MKKIKLSVIIIARNEEAVIGEALKSIAWADEVIVVDNGSTDRTPQIAKACGAKVISVPWRKFEYSRWRNIGLGKARGDWVFYLDADERATPALKKEILRVIDRTDLAAWSDISRSDARSKRTAGGNTLSGCGNEIFWLLRVRKKGK